MQRRGFLVMSLAGTLATPRVSEAQPRHVPRVAVLSLSEPRDHLEALEQGLRELGYQPLR
jgi:hypothetical protein